MSSIARVIFLMDCVDLIRRRSTRICAAIWSSCPLTRGRAGRLRPVDLDRLAVLVTLVHRLDRLVLRDDRRPVRRGEVALEALDHALEPVDRLVGQLAGVADLVEDPA